MSIHPGFPDLTPGRRETLWRNIEECKRHRQAIEVIMSDVAVAAGIPVTEVKELSQEIMAQ